MSIGSDDLRREARRVEAQLDQEREEWLQEMYGAVAATGPGDRFGFDQAYNGLPPSSIFSSVIDIVTYGRRSAGANADRMKGPGTEGKTEYRSEKSKEPSEPEKGYNEFIEDNKTEINSEVENYKSDLNDVVDIPELPDTDDLPDIAPELPY